LLELERLSLNVGDPNGFSVERAACRIPVWGGSSKAPSEFGVDLLDVLPTADSGRPENGKCLVGEAVIMPDSGRGSTVGVEFLSRPAGNLSGGVDNVERPGGSRFTADRTYLGKRHCCIASFSPLFTKAEWNSKRLQRECK